jgi:septation ring formation regulator EzrA
MDALKKFELMEKITRELEDLKNSQTAVLNKITKIEVDNMDLGNKKLEETLPDIHQNAADTVDHIQAILDNFEEVKSDFENKNNLDALREAALAK